MTTAPEEAGWEEDPAVLDAFDRWREAVAKGSPINRDELIAGLSEKQQDAFDELIDGAAEVFASLEALDPDEEPTEPDSPQPTGKAERYVDLRDPKSGGMAVVYKARDLELDRDVAYKVMSLAADPKKYKLQFEHEARITARLDHPGIVPIHAMVVDDGAGRPAYAMKHIDGTDLQKSKIDGSANKVLTPAEVLQRVEIVRDACRIVGYAHGLGIVHADLSPRNIMIEQARATYVVDWGLAREVGAASPGNWDSVPRTPHYTAPGAEKGVRTPRTDVYSLGAVLAALVLGVDLDNRPRYDRLTRKTPPGPLRDLIKACLAEGDVGLYPDANAMADEIDAYLKGDSIRAHRDRLHERGWRIIRHHPSAASAIFLATLSLFAAGTVVSRVSANASKDRANHEFEKRRAGERQLHTDRVHAAETAARRGAWNEAMTLYQEAIDDHQPDEVQLRVGRLFGFFATNDEAGLDAEVAALGRRTDLGRYASQVELVRGAHLMCHSGRLEQGRSAILRALKNRGDLLSEADALFAEALVETRAVSLIETLRKSLKVDALHYPARSNLIVALIATGQVDEALSQADQMAGLFPDSTAPAFGRLIVAVLRGDRPAMKANLDVLAKRLDGDLVALRDYCETLAQILDVMTELENGPFSKLQGFTLNMIAKGKLLYLSLKLEGRTVTAVKPLAFAVPSIHLIYGTYGEIIKITREDKPEASRLEALGRDFPEALVQSFLVSKKLDQAYELVQANRLRDAWTAMAELAEKAYVAAEAPTILLRSPIRYQCRFVGMLADVGVLKLDPADDPRRVRRLQDNLHRLVADGRAWPKSRQEAIPFLVKMITSSLTKELAVDWQRDSPMGAEKYRKRCWWLAQLGRTLVEDWLIDEPDNAKARQILGEINGWADRYRPQDAGKP